MKNLKSNQKSEIRNLKSGSILIWTVLLGVALSSAFFFFAVRLGKSGALQRETVQYQGKKAYLESYADYLENSAAPSEMNISFDDGLITGKLTQNVDDEIIGTLDSGETLTFNFSGTIDVEWNLCESNQKGNIDINGAVSTHDAVTECASSDGGYDDIVSGVNVPNPFTIKATDAPFHFHITPVGSTQLVDTKWHLNLETKFGYSKKIKAERVF